MERILDLMQRDVKTRNQDPAPLEAPMRYRDSCSSRRATADLLRWSMGSEPRHGDGYSGYCDYQAPKNPAKPPRSARQTIADVGSNTRSISLRTLAGFLRWALSFGDETRNQKP